MTDEVTLQETEDTSDNSETTSTPRMKINAAGLDLLTRYETFQPKPYNDGTGTLTIGYGHTRTKIMPASITEEEAQDLLREDLAYFQAILYRNILVPLNENQFSALISLVYNIGEGNFRNSTLLRKLNQANYVAAANEFEKWKKGGGKVMTGLVRRRAAEQQLFRTPPPAQVDVNIIPGSAYINAALSDPVTGEMKQPNVEINPAVVQAMLVVIRPDVKVFVPEGADGEASDIRS